MQIAKPQWSQPWRRHPAKWPHSFGVKNAQRRISFQVPTYCVAIRGPQLDFMHQDMFMLSCAYIPLVWSFLCNWLPTWKSKWPGAIPTKSSFTISENHHSALWTYEGTRLLWSKQLAHLWSRNQALLQALRDRFLGSLYLNWSALQFALRTIKTKQIGPVWIDRYQSLQPHLLPLDFKTVCKCYTSLYSIGWNSPLQPRGVHLSGWTTWTIQVLPSQIQHGDMITKHGPAKLNSDFKEQQLRFRI